jgi:hypothetical membrane protein
MRDVPWWGVASSAAAPLLLVGGFTAAASLQPNFDPVADTVSALAAPGAADRWVMTATFLVVAACYVLTALALRPARGAGRLVLIAGAAGGVLVAVNPVQPRDPYPVPHMICAAIGFAGLTAWPACAWRRGPAVPWGLRPAVAAAAVAALVTLLTWFVAELVSGAGQVGLAERVTGAAEAVWPLAVVLSCSSCSYREEPESAVQPSDASVAQASTAAAAPSRAPATTWEAAARSGREFLDRLAAARTR